MLGKPLLGYPVDSLLVEAAQEMLFEIYTGVIVNMSNGSIDLVVSLAGGMDIEQAARDDSSSIYRLETEPGDLLPVYRVRGWLASLKNSPAHLPIDGLAQVRVALF